MAYNAYQDFSHLLQNIVQPIFIIDLDSGQIVDCNKASCNLLNCTEEHFTNKNISDIFKPDTYSLLISLSNFPKESPIDIFFNNLNHASKACYSHEYKDGTQYLILVCQPLYASDIYQKKPTESKHFLNQLINITTEAILIHNIDSDEIIDCNDAFLELFECTKEDLNSSSFSDFFDTDIYSYQEFIATTFRAENLSGIVHHEWQLLKKSGHNIWCDIHMHTIDHYGSKIQATTIQDISLNKINEERQIATEKKYKDIVESSPDIIWEIDPNGIITQINDTLTDILGYSKEEILGHSLFELLNYEKKSEVERFFKIAQKKKKSLKRLINHIRKKDGSFAYLETNGKTILNNSYEIVGFRGISRDFTKRYFIEKELKKTSSLLESVIAQSPIAMMIANAPSGKIAYVNEAFADLFQIYNYKKIIDKSVFDIIPQWKEFDLQDNPIDKEDMPLTQALKGIYSSNKQYKVIRPDGTVKYEMVHGVPIRNDNGDIIAAYVMFPDITQLKIQKQELKIQTEEIASQNEELRSLNDELKERNTTILHMLSELKASKEKAQESDNLKTAFLANMSHEIRTPMNAIVGFSELLNDEDLMPDTKVQYIKIIRNSSEQLIRIITDILDIAKIEANQIDLKIKKFDLNNVIFELITQFTKELPLKHKDHIDIQTDNFTTSSPIIIESDENRIRQVFSNLLDNAIKFTDVGTIHIGYRSDADKITIYLKDPGRGISPQNYSRIFERFFQEETEISKIVGGTGLGLAISKGIIELLGGEIKAKNNDGQGATFSFSIPLSCKISKEKQITDTPLKSKDGIPDLAGKNVMIVEDEAEIYKYIQAVMHSTNANLVWKKDGLEAYNELQNNHTIDLVLMDVRLPHMNGLEITKAIKKVKPELPIIIQTAYAMESDKKEAYAAGCNAYLSKPIRKKILFDIIKDISNQL